MTPATKDIAALLGSRICHDLVSPIGAISNGVELLQMSGEASGPEIDLINESVENANARIRFFRIAFGVAAEDQMVGCGEIRDILRDLTRALRLTIEWQPEADQPRPAVKLAFLTLQCLESAMPWGGHITVSQSEGGWTISGTTDRLKVVDELWAPLRDANAPVEISAAEVQFLLLAALLDDAGRRLTLDMSETGITASF